MRNLVRILPTLVLALAAAPSAEASAVGGGPGIFLQGPAAGTFALPGPSGPGKLDGLLVGPGGPIYHVQATVLPGPGGSGGRLIGVATRLGGPGAGNKLIVDGGWSSGPPGHGWHGGFKAALIRPPSPIGPAQRVGFFQGGFVDPNGPLPPSGHFKGRWGVHFP